MEQIKYISYKINYIACFNDKIWFPLPMLIEYKIYRIVVRLIEGIGALPRFIYKIVSKINSNSNLYEKVKIHYDNHNVEIHYKHTITPPGQTTAPFERSFSYKIVKFCN